MTEPEILAIPRATIKRYAFERKEGGDLGDFVIRVRYVALRILGLIWYDRMRGEGADRDIAVIA